MKLTNSKQLTPFVQSALALDAEFTSLEHLGGELERLSIDSDSGLERAKNLLAKFTEAGQRVGSGVQLLAKTLNEARERAEMAAQSVTIKAQAIQERQQQVDRLLEGFQSLSEMVNRVTPALAEAKKLIQGEPSIEQKALLVRHLSELDSQLGALGDKAAQIKADAQSVNMKTLERNADSLVQSLQFARRNLKASADRFVDHSVADTDKVAN